MEKIWYTKSDVAFVLNVSESRAMNLLQKYNIKPVIDLGRGRGGGLRWSREAIIGLATHLAIAVPSQQPKSSTPPRRNVSHRVAGRSAEELFVELSGGGS